MTRERSMFLLSCAVGFAIAGCGAEPAELAVATAEVVRAGRTADPLRLTVMTFNIHSPGFGACYCQHLVEDSVCTANRCAGRDDCCPCDEDDTACMDTCANHRLDRIAATIAEAGADVVALQEVDHSTAQSRRLDVAEGLRQRLRHLTGEPWEAHFERACYAHPGAYGVALLSSTPLRNVGGVTMNGDRNLQCEGTANEACDNVASAQQREAVYADVQGIRFVGLHLTTRALCAWVRDQQIATAMNHATVPNQPTIVLGDFNEGPAIVNRNFPNATDATANIDSTLSDPCRTEDIDHIVAENVSVPFFETQTFGNNRISDHLAVATSLPREWDNVVSVKLGAHGRNGILFYARSGDTSAYGRGEIYKFDSSGSLRLETHFGTWRKTWHSIVSGDFDGDGIEDDLLFYDRAGGVGAFYRVDDQGHLELLRTYTTWRRTWDRIVAVRLANNRQALVFYDRQGGNGDNGLGQIYRVDTNTSLTSLATHRGWRSSWHTIVSADFDGDWIANDLLFYDADTGTGAFFKLETNGAMTLLRLTNTWRRTWDEIVVLRANNSGPTADYLLFHDRTGGSGGASLTQLYDLHGERSLSEVSWSSSWQTIVRSAITPSTADEVFVYDRARTAWYLMALEGQSGPHRMVGFTPSNPWQPGWKLTHTNRIVPAP